MIAAPTANRIPRENATTGTSTKVLERLVVERQSGTASPEITQETEAGADDEDELHLTNSHDDVLSAASAAYGVVDER